MIRAKLWRTKTRIPATAHGYLIGVDILRNTVITVWVFTPSATIHEPWEQHSGWM
jgi:hypothetical protein